MGTRRRRRHPRRRATQSQGEEQPQGSPGRYETTVPVVPPRLHPSGPTPNPAGPMPTPVDQVWFLMLDGQQVGPMAPAHVKELVVAGRISHETPIRKAAMTSFVPAGRVKGLLPPQSCQEATEPSLPTIADPDAPEDDDLDVWDLSDTQELEL